MRGMRCNSKFSVVTYSIKMFIQANVRAVPQSTRFWLAPPPINFYTYVQMLLFLEGAGTGLSDVR